MDVFNLQAKIGLDDSAYTRGLSSAGGALKDFASLSFKAIGEVTSGFVDLSKTVWDSVSELATFGDHIDKQSQKMNMSAEAYQEWDAIMQHSGTSIDTMQASMKTLSNAVETGNDAFEKLGISQEELQSLNSEQLFERTITALQNMGDDTERTYLAGQLLGRGATELGALLNTSAEDTEKMRQRVHELNGVMSDEAVKASAAFKDSMQDMQTAMSGVKRSIFSELIPSFTEVMDGVTEVLAGEEGGENKIEKGIEQAFEGIGRSAAKLKPIISRLGDSIFSVIKSNLPKIVSNGIQFTTNIATEIISAIPQILNDAGGIIETIGDTISTNIPKLADAAKNAITGFSGYLRENLPILIPEGVNAVVEFAKGITDPSNTGTLIDAAFDIIDGLIEGFTSEDTINAIVDGAPVILDNLIDGIVKASDRLGDAALKISDKLIEYLKDEENREKMKDAADKILTSLLDGFTSLLGEGGEFVYKLGGLIADALGMGEYWQAGNDVLSKWWDGFKAKWDEFKTWFDEEIQLTLNPLKLGKEVGEAIEKAASDAQDKRHIVEKGSSHQRHAQGAVFNRPTYDRFGDLYGEAGTEVLLPLDSNTAWMDKFADKLENKMNGGARYTFNFYYQGGNGMSDAEIEEQAKRLAELSIAQIRAVGGTGF